MTKKEKAQMEKYIEEGHQTRKIETIDGLRDVKFKKKSGLA